MPDKRDASSVVLISMLAIYVAVIVFICYVETVVVLRCEGGDKSACEVMHRAR
jgi:hypothetical protein